MMEVNDTLKLVVVFKANNLYRVGSKPYTGKIMPAAGIEAAQPITHIHEIFGEDLLLDRENSWNVKSFETLRKV